MRPLKTRSRQERCAAMFLCQQTIPTSGSILLTQRSMHSAGRSQRAQLQLCTVFSLGLPRAAFTHWKVQLARTLKTQAHHARRIAMLLFQRTTPMSRSIQLTQRSMHSVGLSQRAQLQLFKVSVCASTRTASTHREVQLTRSTQRQ